MKKITYLFIISILIHSCDQKENAMIGQNALNFELKNINGQVQYLTDFKGKKIMLHFWADWCASCREEFYTLQNVYDTVNKKGATVIGINVGQSSEHVKELITEYNVTFPILRDENKAISEKYHVVGLPMNFFINQKGKIHKVVTGWMDKDKIIKIMDQM